MNRVFGFLGLAGFLAAGTVHGLSLWGVDVADRVPAVWLLHVGIFAVFVPFVFSSRKTLGPRPGIGGLLAIIPTWAAAAVVVIAAYVFVNFLVFMTRTEMGNPAYENGRYVLLNHGHLIREITEAEYATFRANELRGFSGHWLLFYFVPFAYFTFGKTQNQSLDTHALHWQ